MLRTVITVSLFAVLTARGSEGAEGRSSPPTCLQVGVDGCKAPKVFPSVTTGTGNSFQVTIQQIARDDDGSSATAWYAVTVSYSDSTGYFKDSRGKPAQAISAPIAAHLLLTDQSNLVDDGQLTLALQSDGTYRSGAPFVVSAMSTSDGDLETFAWLDVSFSATTKWDSNDSRNYQLHTGLLDTFQ